LSLLERFTASLGQLLLAPSGQPTAAPATPQFDTVIFSNYMTDLAYLMRVIPRSFWDAPSTRFLFLYGESSADHLATPATVLGGRCHFHKPPLPLPFGTHHSKAVFAFSAHGGFIRVIIGTGNFICDDLERKGQLWYAQDFPSRSAPHRGPTGTTVDRAPAASDSLRRDLRAYGRCAMLGFEPKDEGGRALATWPDRLHDSFDFSSGPPGVPVPVLLASVPGYHVSRQLSTDDARSALHQWGVNSLQRVLRASAAAPAHPGSAAAPVVDRTLVWQYSSQGSLTAPFLEALTVALATPHTVRADRSGIRATPATPRLPTRRTRYDAQDADDVQIVASPIVSTRGSAAASTTSVSNVAIVLPTEAEVRGSVEGWRGGLSIPIPMKNMSPLVNDRLHRYTPAGREPGRGRGWHRAMPHLKTYTRLAHAADGAVSAEVLVVTSANLSRAAWGEAQKGGSQLAIRSYELGVVFDAARIPVIATTALTGNGAGGFSLDVSRRILSAVDAQRLAAVWGLHTLALAGPNNRASLPGENCVARCALLPFDAPHCVAYLPAHADARGAAACPDVPWAVDYPHRGPDTLGHTYAEIVQGSASAPPYDHYGARSWDATVVSAF